MPSRNNLIFSIFLASVYQPGITSFLRYSWLAYAIREWRSLAYIRDWQASHSRMAYASQEQALRPPIHEYSRLAYAIREWEVIRDWTRTHVSRPAAMGKQLAGFPCSDNFITLPIFTLALVLWSFEMLLIGWQWSRGMAPQMETYLIDSR